MKVSILRLEKYRLGIVFNDNVTIAYHTQFTGITEELVELAVNQLMVFIDFNHEKLNWLIENQLLADMLTAYIKENLNEVTV